MRQNDPLAALENIDWLISNGGEVSLGAFGPVSCAAVASDEGGSLAMLRRRDGESLYQLLVGSILPLTAPWKRKSSPTRSTQLGSHPESAGVIQVKS